MVRNLVELVEHLKGMSLDEIHQRNDHRDKSDLTETDAIVAYLQVLGTMVDFSKYDEGEFVEYR